MNLCRVNTIVVNCKSDSRLEPIAMICSAIANDLQFTNVIPVTERQNMNRKFKHYIIYKVTNNLNGKIYIGKHKCNKLDDEYFGSGKILHQAFDKYGLENFTFHLELDLKSQEEMDLLEECVVNKDFLQRDDVYNISKGGKNPCMYGEDNPFFGKTHTKEFCDRMSKRFKGKKLSKEHRQHISEGGKRRFEEHPELHLKCATRKGKHKYVNDLTGEIRFFKANNVPVGFTLYVPPPPEHVSEELKALNYEKCRQRNKKSKWYNNGVNEKFCIVGTLPKGYELGRLHGINIGRKYRASTIEKMSKSHAGLKAPNKDKVWITNGKQNTYTNKDVILPSGWWYGMTRHNENNSKK